MFVPKNWPQEIKTILNILPPGYRSKIVDFINLSYQAGFFDGEGTFQFRNAVVPVIFNQDIECLQLFKNRHGGHIGLQFKKGSKMPVYMDGEKVPNVFLNINKDTHAWTMTGRLKGPKSRSYVDKTNFLISILPLQHSQVKIKSTIRAILDLKWSSRTRWEHLIPQINDLDIASSNDMIIREMIKSGLEDARKWFNDPNTDYKKLHNNQTTQEKNKKKQ